MTLRGAAPAQSIAAAGLKPQAAPASVDDFMRWNSIGVHWTVRREGDGVSFYRYGWGCPPLGPVAPVKIDTGEYPPARLRVSHRSVYVVIERVELARTAESWMWRITLN